jgi:hypothetical protein
VLSVIAQACCKSTADPVGGYHHDIGVATRRVIEVDNVWSVHELQASTTTKLRAKTFISVNQVLLVTGFAQHYA